MNFRKAIAAILTAVLLLMTAAGPASARPLPFLPGAKGGKNAAPAPYVPGEVIVKFKPGVKTAEAKGRLFTAHRGLGLAEKRALPNGASLFKTDKDVPEAIEALKKDPRVEYVQPNYIYRPCAVTVNDPLYGQQWGLGGQYGTKAPEAWNYATGEGIIVAVIDTGVDYNHPDLAENIWRNTREVAGNSQDDDGNGYKDDTVGYDFIGNDFLNSQPDNDPMDELGHGTHVAGIIAAVAGNGEGIAGVAPGVKIMALKAADRNGNFTTAAIKVAIDYAVYNGAKVVNMSFAYPPGNSENPTAYFDRALYDTIARYPQTLFVAAAGNNEGNNNDELPVYPACYNRPNTVYDETQNKWVNLPALTNVVSVAALAPGGSLAYFSNCGAQSVDLAAPGEGIISTVPGHDDTGVALSVYDSEKGYRVMFWGLGAEDIYNPPGSTVNAVYDSVMRVVYNFFDITPDDTVNRPVLIVDDDQDGQYQISVDGLGEIIFNLPDVSFYYTGVLEDACYNYRLVKVGRGEDGPSVSAAAYSAVIWCTGHSWSSEPGNPDNWDLPNLTPGDQSNLINYLEQGGKLFLTGSDAGWGIEATDFYRKYLGANFQGEWTGPESVSGSAYGPFEGMNYTLKPFMSWLLDGVEPAWIDMLQPSSDSGKVVLTYEPYATAGGTSMAASFVSGGAALALSRALALGVAIPPGQLISILKQSVTSLGDLRDKVASGGMLNLEQALDHVNSLQKTGSTGGTGGSGGGSSGGSVGGVGGGGAPVPQPKVEPAPGTAKLKATGEAQKAEVLNGLVALDIPAGALPKDASLTVAVAAETPTGAPAGAIAASPVLSFQTSAPLARPVKVGIKYDASRLGSLDPRTLQVFRQNNDGTWAAVGGRLNREKGTVVVELSHFSSYAIFALKKTFNDVGTHWAQRDIELMAARGIIGGYEDGTFRPGKPVTRAELAALLVKLLSLSEVRPESPAFADVEPSAWYYGAVEAAARAGLLAGDGRNFRPDATLTRQEMAAVAVRLAGLTGSAQTVSFADEREIAPWARQAVATACSRGLMRGVDDRLFAPGSMVTRAQCATLLARLGDRLGLFEEAVTLEGRLVMSTVERPHYELLVGDRNYVLLADRSDQALSLWFDAHLGRNIRVKGYLVPGPNIYMRGPVLRVIDAGSTSL